MGFEHGGNTNGCGCPIGNCDCDVERAPEKPADWKLDSYVYNQIRAGKRRLVEIHKYVGGLSYTEREVDRSLQRLRRDGKIVFGSKTGWRARVSLPMTAETKAQVDSGEGCHSGRDGECSWKQCPQLRDNEPAQGGRHCPLDRHLKDEE